MMWTLEVLRLRMYLIADISACWGKARLVADTSVKEFYTIILPSGGHKYLGLPL